MGLYIDSKAKSFKSLRDNVTHTHKINKTYFSKHQFPDLIQLPNGKTIRKPKSLVIYLFFIISSIRNFTFFITLSIISNSSLVNLPSTQSKTLICKFISFGCDIPMRILL